jgi:tRNA(Arg) A34 adenosine deaminase TadA
MFVFKPDDKEQGYMEMALKEAEEAALRGEVPVGAVLVGPSGEVLTKAGNRTEELADPTAHAEVLAIRQAAAMRRSPRLADCDLYVTLEPCAMCAAAISFARLRRVVFGAYDPKGGRSNMARAFSVNDVSPRAGSHWRRGRDALWKILKKFFEERR